MTTIHATSDAGDLVLEMRAELARELRITLRLENRSRDTLFVFDQPWLLDRVGAAVRDIEGVPRSERDGTLRIFVGAPPLPDIGTVSVHFVPLASKVAPGSTWERQLSFSAPVREHNPYFLPEPGAAHVQVDARRLEVFVQLVRERPGVQAQLGWDQRHFSVRPPPKIQQPPSELLHLAHDLSVPVLRRVGAFSRVRLPGEPAEPMPPHPALAALKSSR